jgi:hypothetical protein
MQRMTPRGGVAERVPPVEGARAGSLRPVTTAITLCALVALLLRVLLLSKPGHLLGVTEADDGVLFGNAMRLAGGVIPYRDFSDVQPPGSFLLMLPLALVAKITGSAWGLAIARMLTVAADTANVVLIGLLVRHRGVPTVVMACGIYAVYPDALVASASFLLEPWLNLFCLLGAVAVFSGDRFARSRRRLVLGGAAFGFGVAVKLWALVPLGIVFLLLLAIRRCRWRAVPFLAGGLAGFGVPSLPFWLMAPAAFVDGVFTGQYGRSEAGQNGLSTSRLSDLLGQLALPPLPTRVTAAVLVVLGLLVVAGYLVSRPWALDVYAVAGCVAVFVMLLLPRLYYSHYGSFAGPFLALTVALPVGRLIAVLPVSRFTARALGAAAAVVVGLPLVWVGVRGVQALTAVPGGPSVTVAKQLIPAGSCVLTDSPSYTVAADRFVTRPGCPALVDPQGTLIAMTNGTEFSAAPSARARVSALWLSGLEQAQYVWLFEGNGTRVPWNHELHTYLQSHFRLIAFRGPASNFPYDPPSGLYKRTA